MKIILGADHRGVEAKEKVKQRLNVLGYDTEDVGALTQTAGDDYDDYAFAVAKKVASGINAKGIVFCGSGIGVDIVANKVKGIRCGLGFSKEQIAAACHDDEINMLALASDFLSYDLLEEIVITFLTTEFVPTEKYLRRIEKIKKIEHE